MLLIHSIISVVVVPGPKISLTPIFFNPLISSSGIIPPPKTTNSSRPLSFKVFIISGNKKLCAPESKLTPIASTSSCKAASTISSGV